jgi:hypothetical protein
VLVLRIGATVSRVWRFRVPRKPRSTAALQEPQTSLSSLFSRCPFFRNVCSIMSLAALPFYRLPRVTCCPSMRHRHADRSVESAIVLLNSRPLVARVTKKCSPLSTGSRRPAWNHLGLLMRSPLESGTLREHRKEPS